ncbi:ABC transporter [Achlya hypogyna]|uniref:ABC transporter n=1 Tax=Achlya hypogyna TaxID=1202772 RepID=A0A1V9YXA1_ACHHY|nr:ABC transporter [Achlya hypogyna]
MDQITRALSVAHCSVNESTLSRSSILEGIGETKYSNGLLASSFVVVLVICLFSVYAFVRSHKFHLRVRHEIALLEGRPDKPSELSAQTGSQLPMYTISFAYLAYFAVDATGKEKQILQDVSGTFRPRRLTAIMGASGSGKTTLLNLLSGRVYSGRYHGYRLLNNAMTAPAAFNTFMSSQGYVEQTDTFIETLTVRESLLFSAYLRLPDSMSLGDKIARVHTVLRVVQLYDAANTPIGGLVSGLKGLSGGQKRRLSIATELLRLPSVLILDEPTSGLDSTSSLLLVKLLAQLAAQQGLTVVSTIHQPRAEIFELFDDVVLMEKGGNAIYCGPQADVVEYLRAVPSLPLRPDSYDNPADFIIDALGLDPERETTKTMVTTESPFSPHWQQSPTYKAMMASLARYAHDADETYKTPKQSWLHVQTWTCFERRYSRVYSKRLDTLLRNLQTLVVSLVIATAFSYSPMTQIAKDPSLTALDKQALREYGVLYQNVMLMFTMGAYGMVLEYLEIIPEYFIERPLLEMERKSNAISFYSYVYALFLIETPKAVMNSVLLMSVTMVVHSWEDLSARSVLTLYLIFILGTCAWQSLICFACAVSNSMPPVYGVVFLLLGSGLLFSGICVSHDDMWSFWYWCYYGSAPALMSRSLIIASTSSAVQLEMLVQSGLLRMSLDGMFGVILLTIVLGRGLAIAVFYWREARAKKLQYTPQRWIDERLHAFAQA